MAIQEKRPLPLKGGSVTLPPPTTVKEMLLDDIDPFEGKRILIVGPSGAGKTWLSSTWPNPAFIDADFNIATLKQASYKKYTGGEVKPIIVAQVQDEKDPLKKYVTKATGMWDLLAKTNEWSERPDIHTVVYDSLTAISALASSLGVHIAGEEKLSQTEKEAKNKLGVMLMVLGDYKGEMGVMEQFLSQLPEIGKTVICVAHSRAERNDKGALLNYTPLLTGEKLRAGIGRWFNEVWWLEVQGSGDTAKRVLMCQQDNLHPFVKTTMDLPRYIENPTYTKIMKFAKAGV